ncbi:MAG TPA: cupin domain-containing protein [Nitrosopumilaceae archaeon]|jgi:quercetin dioxygenase-like cupin family protein|nr:cupin domain-containing protein [Nitrosopumilaceae archaeon]
MQLKTISILIGIGFVLTFTGVYFVIAADDVSSQTILDTTTTIIGQEIQYSSGSQIISKIVTIPVGAETGPHIHENPMFAYIMDGEVTVDYGEQGIKTFVKGESMVEAINYTHNGKNNGDTPTKILVVLIGEK